MHRLAAELPAETPIHPTHGFGSFCAATPGSGDSSTVGDQRLGNPALTQDEQSYVDELIAGLTAYPAYYAHMGVDQRRRASVQSTCPIPRAVDAKELRRRIDGGEWVVDLRSRTAFAAGHLEGTLGFELSTSFVTYLGWLYQWGAPLTLIGDDRSQISTARRELARIGVDNITGAAVGDARTLGGGAELRSYRTVDFHDLAHAPHRGELTLLDVRQTVEYDDESHSRCPEYSSPGTRGSPRRGARRRSLGPLRIRLSGLHRRIHSRSRTPPRRAR